VRLLRSFPVFLVRNWVFFLVLTLGLALRVLTMLGFPPAIWFAGDSIVYVKTALTHIPSVSRQGGYSVMLAALKPLHSFAVVTTVQHLMGLAMGVMTYALLRKYRLPRWGAALATTPILLDAYAIQLEQEVLPDVLFAFLAVTAIALLLGWPAAKRPVAAGPAAAHRGGGFPDRQQGRMAAGGRGRASRGCPAGALSGLV